MNCYTNYTPCSSTQNSSYCPCQSPSLPCQGNQPCQCNQCSPSCQCSQCGQCCQCSQCCNQTSECFKSCQAYLQCSNLLGNMGDTLSAQSNIAQQVYFTVDNLISALTNKRDLKSMEVEALSSQYTEAKLAYDVCIANCSSQPCSCISLQGYCIQCSALGNTYFTIENHLAVATGELEELNIQIDSLTSLNNWGKIRLDQQNNISDKLITRSNNYADLYDNCNTNCAMTKPLY